MSIFMRIRERSSILKKNNNSNDTLISLGNKRIYFRMPADRVLLPVEARSDSISENDCNLRLGNR